MRLSLYLIIGLLAGPPPGEDEAFQAFARYYLQKLRRARADRPADVQRLLFFDRLLDHVDYDRLTVAGQIDFDILRTRVWEKVDEFRLAHGALPDIFAFFPPADFVEMAFTLLSPATFDQVLPRAVQAVREAKDFPDWLKASLRDVVENAHREVSLVAAVERRSAHQLALALKDLKEHLAALEPPSTGPPKREPTARERYHHRIRYTLLSDHTPEELLDLGMRMYRETVEELERVARAVDPGRSWQEILGECREECWDAAEIHERAKELAGKARDFAVEKDLVTIPESARGFSVRRGSRGQITPFGHYRPGKASRGAYVTPPLDGLDGPTLEDRRRDNNPYWTTIVALHEAVPGHHLQFDIARKIPRNELRALANTSAYVEGWGLYCEEMMFRAGYYPDGSKQRLVALQMRLWRCARVVIDVGLQTGAIAKEEAVDLLAHGVGMSRSSARLEVDHYAGRPTYFCGYLLGFLEFEALRRECEKRLGARFDLKAYHDFLLRLGPLPLSALRKAVVDWAK